MGSVFGRAREIGRELLLPGESTKLRISLTRMFQQECINLPNKICGQEARLARIASLY